MATQKQLLTAVAGVAAKAQGSVTSVNGATGDVVIGTAATIDTDSTFAANSDVKVPSQKAVKAAHDALVTSIAAKLPTSDLDTDTALTANSDAKIATQKATKAAIATAVAAAEAFCTKAPVAAPASAVAAGVAGTWSYDATHIYVCIATNTWVRAVLAAW